MASGVFGRVATSVPAHLLIFELLASSSAIGFSASNSPIRALALPAIAACSYGIVKTASAYMRSRWTGLFGGFGFAILLRYIDVALLSRWDFRAQGPTKNIYNKENSKERLIPKPKLCEGQKDASLWERLAWGWSALWSFRQIDTLYEVPNTPPFNSSDPEYVPSKWSFLLQKTAIFSTCYLILDLLDQKPPSANAATIFNPTLIPLFRRLGTITWPQIKLRAISVFFFGVTFYCIIQGLFSLAAAITVGTGFSDVRRWRPVFGSPTAAYSLRNFWGKVWHQNLRQLITSPASYVVYNVLGLQRKTQVATAANVFLSFMISGALHVAAGSAGGMPLTEVGVLQFFGTQALGVIFESLAVSFMQSGSAQSKRQWTKPGIVARCLGACWVFTFLAWSGPVWLYPQASRPSQPGGAASFVPFSIIKALAK